MPQIIGAIGSFIGYVWSAFSSWITGNSIWAAAARWAITFAVSYAASTLFAPKSANRSQADVTTLKLGEQPREAIFGLACTGGSLVDAFNYGPNNEWEVLVIALADHECEQLVSFYANDQSSSYTDAHDGAQLAFNEGATPSLMVFWQPGTLDQTALDYLTTNAPSNWGADDKLVGVSYVAVGYRRSERIWPQGRPRFRWVLKGKKLYDPRLDDTVEGGEGDHRWNDPSTYEYSDNAALCEYNWRRGVWTNGQLIVGPGRSAEEAPPAEAIAAINACDEDVPLKAGGTEKRYRCGAVVRADERWIDTQKEFARAMAGDLIDRAGCILPDPGVAKFAVMEFTDADLIEGRRIEFVRFLPRDELVNTVTTQYIAPSQMWNPHSAPLRRDADDIESDGEPRETRLELNYVWSQTQAQRVGEILRRRARYQRRATVTLGARYIVAEIGDWIEWTSARYMGGAAIVFEVIRVVYNGDGTVELSLREIAGGVFTWNEDTDELSDASQGFVDWEPLPDAEMTDFAVEPVTVTHGDSTLPAFKATWDASAFEGDGSIKHILLEWRQDGETDIFSALCDVELGEAIITSVVSLGDYEVRATPKTQPRRGETPTSWLPVTVGELAGANGQNVARARIYQRATSTPTLPSATVTFTFATGAMTGLDNGWTATIPAGTDPLYISEATAANAGTTDDISAGEWASPVILVQNGAPGADGDDGANTATVWLYQRSASAPSAPGSTLTYTFASGVLSGTLGSWSQTVPAHDGNPLYVISATALSTGATDTIGSGEWSTVRVMAADGVAGNWRDIRFKRSTTQPSTPTGGTPSGWSNGIPSGTETLWAITALKNATGDVIGTWSTPERFSPLAFRGAYDAGTTYQLHDVATYNGGTYICTNAPSTGVAPSGTGEANSVWDVLAAPGAPGEPGDPPSGFTATIDLTSSSSGLNLRTVANAAGYTGLSDATILFRIPNGVTITGAPGGPNGGIGIDSGTWPSGYSISLSIEGQSGGVVYGGGGKGGNGGDAGGNGGDAGFGGDAFYLRHAFNDITFNSGFIARGGGGGGAGGGGGIDWENEIFAGGGGGGGGRPNGPGGNAGSSVNVTDEANNGGTASTSADGDGGDGANNASSTVEGQTGAQGGNFASTGGSLMGTGTGPGGGGIGGAPGVGGYCVRKNGHTAPVTNNGTTSGTIA